jgi:hypothetical protein
MKQEESKNTLWTKNMFLESCNELNLGLGQDLNEKMIVEAHGKFVKQQLEFTSNNILPNFDINEKDRAKEYLINSIKPKA